MSSLTGLALSLLAPGASDCKSKSYTSYSQRIKEEAVPVLTVDNRGVHYNASQIWVRHRFVQDEPSDAAEREIIRSLSVINVRAWQTDRDRQKGWHGKRNTECLHLNDAHSMFVCFSRNEPKNASSAGLIGCNTDWKTKQMSKLRIFQVVSRADVCIVTLHC